MYGHPNSWPSGKKIGSQPLSKVILEARNQSTHNDEAIKNGSYKKVDVINCFNMLEQEIDPIFADFLTRDMSFDIIKVLGWKTYEDYRKDMESITSFKI